ncbi:MAG: hypothetical protein WAW23_12475, partial [Candidatus Methanoperedens sp.]
VQVGIEEGEYGHIINGKQLGGATIGGDILDLGRTKQFWGLVADSYTRSGLSLGQTGLSPAEQGKVVNSVFEIVKEKVPYVLYGEWDVVNRVRNVDDLLREGGVCRHQAALSALVLESLIQQKTLDGKVYVNYGPGHAWAEFVPSSGERTILDVAQNYIGPATEAKKQFLGSGGRYEYKDYSPQELGSKLNAAARSLLGDHVTQAANMNDLLTGKRNEELLFGTGKMSSEAGQPDLQSKRSELNRLERLAESIDRTLGGPRGDYGLEEKNARLDGIRAQIKVIGAEITTIERQLAAKKEGSQALEGTGIKNEVYINVNQAAIKEAFPGTVIRTDKVQSCSAIALMGKGKDGKAYVGLTHILQNDFRGTFEKKGNTLQGLNEMIGAMRQKGADDIQVVVLHDPRQRAIEVSQDELSASLGSDVRVIEVFDRPNSVPWKTVRAVDATDAEVAVTPEGVTIKYSNIDKGKDYEVKEIPWEI